MQGSSTALPYQSTLPGERSALRQPVVDQSRRLQSFGKDSIVSGIVFAGIVTYEPDLARLASNLQRIAPQVARVLLFDNGSTTARQICQVANSIQGVEVHLSADNLGIATALNRLCRLAAQSGASHLVTLDQDSEASDGMVASLVEVSSPEVPIVTPFIVDRNKMTVTDFLALELPPLQYYRDPARKGAITSGSLIDLEVIRAVGGFADDFFIDYVDYELNARIMANGYRIARNNRTYLLHEVGRACSTWLWVPRKSIDGKWTFERFYSFGHTPFRCYYKARNRVLYTRRHWKSTILKNEGIWQIPQQLLLTLIFENQRPAKALAFVRGTIDGVVFRQRDAGSASRPQDDIEKMDEGGARPAR